MTTRSQLKALLEAVRNNPLVEPQFFEALLSATVYAHVPVKQVPGRIRFVQFHHPDNGKTLLPFFTDLEKAERALGVSRDISVIAMDARSLFELTRGATLMLDPNDDQVALYPEEVAALLEGRPLVAFSTEEVSAPEKVGLRTPTIPVEQLTALLETYCQSEAGVTAGYIVEVLRGENNQEASLLVALAAPNRERERIMRASMQCAQPALAALELPLLMTVIEPEEGGSSFYQQATQFYGLPGIVKGADPMPSTEGE